jgi:AcrR family transcriptional regulator
MPTRSRGARLGGAELGTARHVCGLFDGPDDKAAQLQPFVLEGIAEGDRVIYVVEDRAAQLDVLAGRTDVPAALASGQLEVLTWDESYLAGGRFSARRMLAYIRHLFREGLSPEFGSMRLVGEMEWAHPGVAGVDQLVEYERGLDAILARPGAWAVCAYDVRRHPDDLLAEVTPLHQAAISGGRLQKAGAAGSTPSPRQRILAAASLLFAETGISQTGVDSLIEAAGVAKATFYRHFPSKDALVVAWLEDPRTRWFDRVKAEVEAKMTDPAEVVSRLFEAVAEWLEDGDFVGCPYLNTAIEVNGSADPAAEASRSYLAEIGGYLRQQVAEAGYADADRLGPELHALLAGAISLGVANRSTVHVLAARDAARRLLAGTARL